MARSFSPCSSPVAVPSEDVRSSHLRWFLFILFFAFGGITSLNDILTPKLKHLFTLSHTEAMLVQLAFFAAYFLVSLPAAALVKRVGYMGTVVIGLVTMTAGCLLLILASYSVLFFAFLGALFVLGAGITTVQVVANPLISMLGKPQTAHSRLAFAQAFNALGTTLFPYIGAVLILGSLAGIESGATPEAQTPFPEQETETIVGTYLGLAIALLIVAGAVWARRNRIIELPSPEMSLLRLFDLLKRPRFAFGTLGIFVYVGAEVAIGSLLVNYLMQADALGVAAQVAGQLTALYWGGAMVGRFIGAGLLRIFPPALVLFTAACGSAALLAVSAFSEGAVSGYAILAIGFCNSIMFPTIFSLASERLDERAADGSGIICMAVVGGAIVPLLTGIAADATSLRGALWVPFFCYGAIAAFGFYCHRDGSQAEIGPGLGVDRLLLQPVAEPLTAPPTHSRPQS